MITKKLINRILSVVFIISSIVSTGSIPLQAASISDGNSKTVTIEMGTRYTYLESTAGVALGGEAWTYLTNDGISGPAYCINHGLSGVPSGKELTIGGPFTSSPQTAGAFANGFPQRSLEDFVAINISEYPELAGLTESEYAYGTRATRS